MRRTARLQTGIFLAAVLCFCPCTPGWGQVSPQLVIRSKSAVLMDRATGQVLFEKNPRERSFPASLAKVMTLYLAMDSLQRGDVGWNDEVVVSKRAWKMGGSQMFLEAGDRVKFIELIKGCAVVSANDAAYAIAEFLAGSEEVFVHRMNEKARALGMKDTHFVNPHGLPRDGQYTTAGDMATLGFHYVHQHPEALKFHALKAYAYGGIEQKNRNPLLTWDPGVDGLKTGYLRVSGYHLLFSLEKGGMGLIGAVMGAENPRDRKSDALELIRYGLENFSPRTLIKAGEVVGKAALPKGDPPELTLLTEKALKVTVRKGMDASIPLRKEIPTSVAPPVSQGCALGRLVLDGEGLPGEEIDLVASHDVEVKSRAPYYLAALAFVLGPFGLFCWRRLATPQRHARKP